MEHTDIERAAQRIAGWVRRTPVLHDSGGPHPCVLKLEQLQHTGSFKPRGMFNRILAARERGNLPESGVIAASGGNAGLAVAHAAAALGVPAEVFVPTTAPAIKVEKLRRLGAVVSQHGAEYADAYEAAVKRGAETGALFCHAYDQPDVVAGQGTVGLEIAEQLSPTVPADPAAAQKADPRSGPRADPGVDPGVDTVLVAVGGGGLIAGIAAALHGRVRVVAVEPETCPTLHSALAAGRPVDVPVSGVASDSLGARRIGDIAYDVAVRTGLTGVLVPDEAITAAQGQLWDRCRLVTEPGGATAYAALSGGAYRPEPGERICVLVCGANVDPARLTGSA